MRGIQSVIAAACAALVLVGCGGGGGAGQAVPAGVTSFRTVVASAPSASTLDVLMNSRTFVENMRQGFRTPYVEVPAGNYTISFRDDASRQVVTQITTAEPLLPNETYTGVAYLAEGGKTKSFLLQDDSTLVDDKARLRVVNATRFGAFDVYLVPPATDLTKVEPVYRALMPETAGAYVEFNPQRLDLWLTRPGEKTPFYDNSFVLNGDQVRTLTLGQEEDGSVIGTMLPDVN